VYLRIPLPPSFFLSILQQFNWLFLDLWRPKPHHINQQF
jgi:hypothetical protein